MQKQKILIAILSVDNWVRGEYLELMGELVKKSSDPEHPYSYQVTTIVGFKPLAAYAHNEACRRALALGADWLWFWSHDMIPVDGSFKLLDYLDQADILNLTVYNVVGNPPRLCTMSVQEVDGQHVFAPTHRTTEPYEPVAMGSGGMIVKRGVLEDRVMWTESDTIEGVPPLFRDVFDGSMKRRQGHDLDFTRRAKKLGYRLLTVPEAYADHLKEVGLTAMARMISLGWNKCYDEPNSKED